MTHADLEIDSRLKEYKNEVQKALNLAVKNEASHIHKLSETIN